MDFLFVMILLICGFYLVRAQGWVVGIVEVIFLTFLSVALTGSLIVLIVVTYAINSVLEKPSQAVEPSQTKE